MQEEIVKFRDLPEYEQNPFIEPILSIKTKNKTIQFSSTKNMVLNSDGEYIGDQMMSVFKKVDKEEFVKIFKDQLSIIFDLSRTAQRVLTYFIKTLGVNKDYIVFDKGKAKEISGLASNVSLYIGLSELIQKGVIAKSNLPLMYYINPRILFNGDRLVVINGWIKDDKLGIDSNEEWKSLDEHPAE